MWRIIVILVGGSGVTILALFVFVLALCLFSWQAWVIMGFFLVLYLISGDSKKVVKGRAERRNKKKALKALRVQKAKEKQLREMNKDHIQVVAAVICDDNDRIFATQRGYGDIKGKWEFPGGKIEPGETREEALKREIREELAAEITIEKYLEKVEWSYPKFRLTMYCYLCRLEGEYTLKEHSAARWLSRRERMHVKWLPADRTLFDKAAF